MMAGRRRSLGLLVVVAAVVLPLVLVPAPLVSSARVPPKAGAGAFRYSSRAKPQAQKMLRSLLKKWAKHEVKDLLSSSSSGGGQLNNAASSSNTAGVFIFDLSVGTSSPPQDISGILDITSELVWSQCAPCDTCLPPPATSFNPTVSPTFTTLSCDSQMCPAVLKETCAAETIATADCDMYNVTYGDGDTTFTVGYLATDTLTFGGTPIPGFVFGCSGSSVGDFSGASGVLGFNLGNLSLVSQLQLTWFSYLLASDASAAGGGESDSLLLFGDGSVPPATSKGRSTPLLSSSLNPTLYFVSLTGIRVDGHDLAIPAGTFDLLANGSGGVFPSTTVPVTYLEQAAYDAVKKAIAGSKAMPKPVDGSELGLDLCYTMASLKNVTVPELELVFDGAAVMTLQRYNYFFADNTTGLDCLTILPSVGGSLLGSLLQTGTNMTYDIAHGQLIFETQQAQMAAAASPAKARTSLIVITMMLNLALWVLLF